MAALLNIWPLIFFPISLSVGQVLFKYAGNAIAGKPVREIPTVLLFSGHFWAALVVYGVSTLFWVWALSRVPLSQAYAFVGLSFILVPLFAMLFHGETMSIQVLLGSVLVAAGVVLTNFG